MSLCRSLAIALLAAFVFAADRLRPLAKTLN